MKKFEREDIILKEKTLIYFKESKKRLSIINIHKLLQSKNILCFEKRVARIMELNLKCIRTKKAKNNIGTNYKDSPSCNKLQLNFTQIAPNIFVMEM